MTTEVALCFTYMKSIDSIPRVQSYWSTRYQLQTKRSTKVAWETQKQEVQRDGKQQTETAQPRAGQKERAASPCCGSLPVRLLTGGYILGTELLTTKGKR